MIQTTIFPRKKNTILPPRPGFEAIEAIEAMQMLPRPAVDRDAEATWGWWGPQNGGFILVYNIKNMDLQLL